ncbi:glycosyltransferase family 4 protein [Roseburia hominis]
MRILSVTAQKPNSTGSGVYLTELMKGFEKLGHEQAAVVGVARRDTVQLPGNAAAYPVYYGTEELPYPVAGMSDEMPYDSTRYSDMTEEMTRQFREAFGAAVRQAVSEFKPDVILCHHLYFLTALVRKWCPKVRVFGVCHGSDLRQFKKNPWQREWIKAQICQLDGIFALHKEQKEEIIRCFGCEEKYVYVIGTGYNNSIFYIDEGVKKDRKAQEAVPTEETVDNDEIEAEEELCLIFAGKVSEKKGIKSLLKAMDYLKGEQIRLVLAGGYATDAEFEELCKLAEKCPCKVEFPGRMPQQELAQLMNASDLFVLPSFYEGLPLVLVEAMACGLRAVCTELPGIRPWLVEKGLAESVVFVKPPEMRNEDEPVEEALPDFEKRLAQAVIEAKEAALPNQEKLREVSWDGVCRRVLELMLNMEK